MSEKIYVISCSQDLASMGLDRIRSSVEGLEKINIAIDWSNAQLVPVIAQEKVPMQPGETMIVSVEPIEIPAFAQVLQSFYGTNGMGHLACVGSLEFKKFDEARIADKAMFQSRLKAAVMKGDLLGQVLIVPGEKK